MLQHHGRLSTYMGIIKGIAQLTREPSRAIVAAMARASTRQGAVEHGALGSWAGQERRSGSAGRSMPALGRTAGASVLPDG